MDQKQEKAERPYADFPTLETCGMGPSKEMDRRRDVFTDGAGHGIGRRSNKRRKAL
jgi:hypothetical protein